MGNADQCTQTVVCVVGVNLLAVRYISQLLSRDSSLQVCSEDAMFPGNAHGGRVIYLLDGASLPIPLSELLHRSAAISAERRHLLVAGKHSTDELLEFMRNGLHGFVGHDDLEADLVSAIHAVELSLWMPRDVLQLYVQLMTDPNRRSRAFNQMTDRESEILNLVKARLSNKEIAAMLDIRESTVKFHLSNIFAKRNVTNRRALLPIPAELEWRTERPCRSK